MFSSIDHVVMHDAMVEFLVTCKTSVQLLNVEVQMVVCRAAWAIAFTEGATMNTADATLAAWVMFDEITYDLLNGTRSLPPPLRVDLLRARVGAEEGYAKFVQILAAAERIGAFMDDVLL